MKSRRGVTLIEMLIAMSVVSVVLIAVLNVFNSSQRLWNNQVSRSRAILEANDAMEAMCKEIGNAVNAQNDLNGTPSIFVMPANKDAGGNYVPASSGGTVAYGSGVPIQFFLADKNGTVKVGIGANKYLWRQTAQSGGLLGGLLGGLTWTQDTAWSTRPGGAILKYPGVMNLTFTTAGLPANTVQVSLTVKSDEGRQSSDYTVTRIVYLSHHN